MKKLAPHILSICEWDDYDGSEDRWPIPEKPMGNGYSSDPWLYHATLSWNIKKILESGLVLKPSVESNYFGDLGAYCRGKLFFAETPELAEYYALVLKNSMKAYDYIVVFRVLRADIGKVFKDKREPRSFYVKNEVSLKNADLMTDRGEWIPVTPDVLEKISRGDWDDSIENEEDE